MIDSYCSRRFIGDYCGDVDLFKRLSKELYESKCFLFGGIL